MQVHARPKEMGIYGWRTKKCIENVVTGKFGKKGGSISQNASFKRISLGFGGGQKGGFKIWISPNTDFTACEMDEIHWFLGERKTHQNGVNAFALTIASRIPRQIVAFDAANSVRAQIIQDMVDSVKSFGHYFVDGCRAYREVYYHGKLKQNFENKNDTYIIEGTNSDVRCYIAGLQRRSRCFFRKFETMKSVLWLFINAYNKFGEWKRAYRERHPNCGRDFSNHHIHFI